MVSEVRKRTAAQRKGKAEDVDDVVIQDEQEQEDEIRKARTENEQAKRKAQVTMDIGVLVAVLINALWLAAHISQLTTMAFTIVLVQTLLLPLSLTPRWISQMSVDKLEEYHVLIVTVQLALAGSGAWLLGRNERWSTYDLARLGLALTVSAGVEVQRRGDRDLERKLRTWESTRYHVKGA